MSEPMHNWPASQWAIYYGKKADEAMRRGCGKGADTSGLVQREPSSTLH